MNSAAPTASPGGVPLFGVIVPPSAVRTDFLPADSTGLKYTLALSNIPGEAIPTIPELVFFLLPGAALPPGHGAMLYWQASTTILATGVTTTTGFELLGSITPDRPSGVFRTGWSTNEALVATGASSVTLTLGVSVEAIANIQNLQGGGMDRTNVAAKKIAMNLFNFLKSFDDVGSRAGMMTVPTNVFERWLAGFEKKLERDPNFYMKTSDS